MAHNRTKWIVNGNPIVDGLSLATRLGASLPRRDKQCSPHLLFRLHNDKQRRLLRCLPKQKQKSTLSSTLSLACLGNRPYHKSTQGDNPTQFSFSSLDSRTASSSLGRKAAVGKPSATSKLNSTLSIPPPNASTSLKSTAQRHGAASHSWVSDRRATVSRGAKD